MVINEEYFTNIFILAIEDCPSIPQLGYGRNVPIQGTMINDIDQGIDANISLFADDSRISRSIKSEDCVEKLQEEL